MHEIDFQKNVSAIRAATSERAIGGRAGTPGEIARDYHLQDACTAALDNSEQNNSHGHEIGVEMPLDSDARPALWMLSRVFGDDNFGFPLEHAISNLSVERKTAFKEAGNGKPGKTIHAIIKFLRSEHLEEIDAVTLHGFYQEIGIRMGEKNLGGPLTDSQKARMGKSSGETLFKRVVPEQLVEQVGIGIREATRRGMFQALQGKDPITIFDAYTRDIDIASDENTRTEAMKRRDFVVGCMGESHPKWVKENIYAKDVITKMKPDNQRTQTIYKRNKTSANGISPVSMAVAERTTQIFQMGFSAYFDSIRSR